MRIAYTDLLQEENPYGVFRALPPRRQCPHCQQSLLDLLMKRVNWQFRNFYKMFAVYIADGLHLQPTHKSYFLVPQLMT